MNDTPRCPYCGDRMALHILPHTTEQETFSAWCQCVVCESTSPRLEFPGGISNEKIEEQMLAVSSIRAEPKNCVLTLEELDAHCEGGADATPLWVEFNGGANGWVLIAPVRETCKMDFVSNLLATMGILYGKEWRCWTTRPTKEEMKNMPWEE